MFNFFHKKGGIEILATVFLVVALIAFVMVFASNGVFKKNSEGLPSSFEFDSKTNKASKDSVSINKDSTPIEIPNPSENPFIPSSFATNEISVEEINNQIEDSGLDWVAEENEISKLSVEDQKRYLGIEIDEEIIRELEFKGDLSSFISNPSSEFYENKENKFFLINKGEIITFLFNPLNKVFSKSFLFFKGIIDVKITGFSVQNSTNFSELPLEFDWRNVHGKNYITPVKNQASCGSCWAFGTLGLVEGQANTYYNQYLDLNLSEQDLISCFHPGGCHGLSVPGFLNLFKYLQINKAVLESCFPYVACDALGHGSCSTGPVYCSQKCSNWNQTSFAITNYKLVPLQDIESLKRTLVEKGPVEAGMIVYQDFPSYSGGIYSHSIDVILGAHAVLIVGYGEEDGLSYWIVKNSWGSGWGENGYFRIAIGDSYIESFLLFAVTGPLIPNPNNISCEDNDQDGFCYWGTGDQKPNNCPISCSNNPIPDCEDSNFSLTDSCVSSKNYGFLNISSNIPESKVYVKNLNTGKYSYRGKIIHDSFLLKLDSGEREIKITNTLCKTFFVNVSIVKNVTNELFANMTYSSYFEILDGWPNKIEDARQYSVGSTPILEDINGDGKKEIIVDLGGIISVWDSKGVLLSGWPIDTGSGVSSGEGVPIAPPLVGDIDGDGKKEIISIPWAGFFYNDSSKSFCGFAFKEDGSPVLGWNNNCDLFVFNNYSYNFTSLRQTRGSSSLIDLDNDGNFEVVVAIGEDLGPIENIRFDTLAVLEGNGSYKEGWPINENYFASFPKVYDLDGDGKKEIIIFHRDKYVLVYSDKGILKKNLTSSTSSKYLVPRGDLDAYILNDFKNNRNYFFYQQGAILTKIDLNTGNHNTYLNNDYPSSKLTIVDLKNEGIEQVISSFTNINKNYVSFLDVSGSSFIPIISSGWPQEVNPYFEGSPQIADVNGDGKQDILTISPNGKIYAWDIEGNMLEGFPLDFDVSLNSGLAIEDIDGDGLLEMFFGSGSFGGTIYGLKVKSWKTNNTHQNLWPMWNANPQNTGIVKYYRCLNNSLIGDANGDGQIDIDDASTILNIFVQRISPYENVCCLDTNKDNNINSADALLIAKYLNGINSTNSYVGQRCNLLN